MRNAQSSNEDMDDQILSKFFEEIVNESVKRLGKIGIINMPTKFKMSVEFGDNGPRFNYIAKATYDTTMRDKRRLTAIDVINRESFITVIAEVPNIGSGGVLEIKASKSALFINVNGKIETVRLPNSIDAERAMARINNGILEVNMPIGDTKGKTRIKIVDIDAEKSD